MADRHRGLAGPAVVVLSLVLLLATCRWRPAISPPPALVGPAGSPAATTSPEPRSERLDRSLDVNGGQRRYRLFVPAGLRPEQPAPLVVNFHGLGGDAASQERLSGFSELAETAVFLVVYPEGLGLRAQGWQIRPGAADVVFIRRLVADLRAEFAIDPARIYATGLSNGGGMVHRLACDAADLFAAVAPVAGAYTFHDDCRPGRPVPILIFHSRDDKVVPFTGSFQTPDLDQFAAAWARRNGCAGQAVESEPTPRARLSQWSNCDGSTALYALADTGHHWPGSRLGPDSLPASTLIWDFFQTQTLAP